MWLIQTQKKGLLKVVFSENSIKELEILLDQIFDIEIQCKKNYDVSTVILQNFVINISTKTALEKIHTQ